MGCLNSLGQFNHWFGNIHLSGPCNRRCYFCIGQHMMALDAINNLDQWPLKNIDYFIDQCIKHNINEINVTGSNTDPLLYQHLDKLHSYLSHKINNLVFGIRTNGISFQPHHWQLIDKLSISITSLDNDLYLKTMGCGQPPNIEFIINQHKPLKINTVLCPETVNSGDVFNTIYQLADLGIQTINLREPYGQPHIGNPLSSWICDYLTHGMPTYIVQDCHVTYWDVHYVEVESVNLYSNGKVSSTYPVSKGHCDTTGKVLSQDNFKVSGRVCQQWVDKEVVL